MLALLAFVTAAHAVEDFYGMSYYFGDLHAHTGGSSDGASNDLRDCRTRTCGRYQDLVEIARDDNGLDFVGVVDHSNGIMSGADDADFATVFSFVNAANDEAGGFITIPGAEVHFASATTEFGHKSLLLFGDEATVATAAITDFQPAGAETGYIADCAAIGTFFDTVEASFGETLMLPHHPAADRPMPTDWSCFDERYEPAVELYSEHGNSLDESGYDPLWGGYVSAGTVTAGIDPDQYGLRFGFFGGSDNHDTHPGQVCGLDSVRTSQPFSGAITIAMMETTETFNRGAIHDAIAERRTYASTGPQLPIAVEYTQRGAVIAGMGDEIDFSGPSILTGRVRMPSAYEAAILAVTFVGPDSAVAATEVNPGIWRAQFTAATVQEYYYVDVEVDGDLWWIAIGGCEDGGGDTIEHVWGTPTWFD